MGELRGSKEEFRGPMMNSNLKKQSSGETSYERYVHSPWSGRELHFWMATQSEREKDAENRRSEKGAGVGVGEGEFNSERQWRMRWV